MAGGLDSIREQLKKIGAVDLAIIGAALTGTENKFKAIGKAVRDIALFRLIPITATLAGALVGVRSVIRDIVKESGALEAAWQRMAKLRGFQNQLEPLLKSAAAARTRIAELMQAASGSRFNVSQWVAGSRAMEILTKGAMGGADSLRLAEAAARTTGGSLDGMADAIGSTWRALREGTPAAQAAGELERLGLVTAQTVAEVARLQESGAGFTAQWAAVQGAIEASTRASDDFSNSTDGLQQRLDEVRNTLAATFGDPFLEAENAAMRDTIAVLQNLAPVAQTVGQTLSYVTSIGDHFGSALTRLASSVLPGLSSAIGTAVKALVVLASGIVAVGIVQFIRTVGVATATVIGWGQALAAAVPLVGRLGVALAALTVRLRAFTLALAANPITLIVTAITTAIAVFWQWRESVAAQVAAVRELNEANRGTLDGLQAQIDAVRTLDEADQAVLATTRALIEAQAKLNALRKEGAPQAQIDAQNSAVAGLAGAQRAATMARDSGRMAPRSAEEAGLRAQAQRAIELDRLARQNAIDLASGPRRIGLLTAERDRSAANAAEGRLTLDERAKFNALKMKVEANQVRMGAGTANAAEEGFRLSRFKASSPSSILREEERIERARILGKGTPKELDARERALASRREQTEGSVGANEQEAARLTAQLAAEERIAQLRAIGERLANNESRLRSEGLQRAEEEVALRISALEKEKKLREEMDDLDGWREADNRLRAEQQRLAEIRRTAGRARGDEARSLDQREAELNGDGSRAVGLDIEARVIAALRAAREWTSDAGEQRDFARRSVGLDIREQLARVARDGVEVSSLQRIGGGGNAAAGLDVLKELAKRQTQLLEIIAKNTGGATGDLTVK